jgi:hypothetical protein
VDCAGARRLRPRRPFFPVAAGRGVGTPDASPSASDRAASVDQAIQEAPMTDYPVLFDVARPARFDRVQIALRVAILVVLSFVGVTLGALFALLYLALPVIAAFAIGQRGSSRFLAEDAPRLARGLRWVMSAFAYMALLTDRLPGEEADDGVRFAIEPGAWPALAGARTPSVATALLRLVAALPSALVLGILAVASWLVWLVAAVTILLTEHYPEVLHGFQCGVLRWQARLFGYLASLVDAYPPFSFDTGHVVHPHDAPPVR